ncbi:MAG: hypothetical protein QM820_26760 [Minicystis sp.]
MDASPPAVAAAPAPSLFRRIFAVAERVAVAHFAAYPIAFLWAVAAIPLTIHLSIGVLDQLDGDIDRVGHVVVRRLVWPAGTAFVLAHATAIPWLLARDPRQGMRRCLTGLGALAILGVLTGAASWLWLMLR